MIRLLDLLISILVLLAFSPFFFIIAVLVMSESRGGAFYVQERIGRNGVPFNLFKFRSMRTGSDKKGLLTVGGRDPRITATGYFLRKYKLDELPQLLNVLRGDMSLVGPRPEVRKYVDLYTAEQRVVLSVKPGVTDYASIEFSNENEILSSFSDPETAYINKIMPEKINLNLKYIQNPSVRQYVKILWLTAFKIFS